MSVETITFGCRLNIVESEAMLAAAQAAGERDLVIVNTCGVTSESVRQGAQAIRRVKRERPEARVAVTGCAVEIEPERFATMAQIDAIVPNARKTQASAWAVRPGAMSSSARVPTASTHTRAFVDVQNGCDHRCTFCVIPMGRGASRSRPAEAVVEAVSERVEAGCREVVLTGVDLTSWGGDLPDAPRLGALVRTILREVPTLPRLRLSSLDCGEIDADLWEAFGAEPRLMPHLHLSLQSGADLILKRMKRRHSRRQSIETCRRARALRPEAAIGADLIVGFPTESEDTFQETLALVEDCGLDFLHVFPYSSRPQTPAARMPQVPAQIVKDRAARLRDCGEAALARRLSRQVGGIVRVLAEKGGRGHAEDYACVRLPQGMAPGEIADVFVRACEGRELIAEAL